MISVTTKGRLRTMASWPTSGVVCTASPASFTAKLLLISPLSAAGWRATSLTHICPGLSVADRISPRSGSSVIANAIECRTRCATTSVFPEPAQAVSSRLPAPKPIAPCRDSERFMVSPFVFRLDRRNFYSVNADHVRLSPGKPARKTILAVDVLLDSHRAAAGSLHSLFLRLRYTIHRYVNR
jgi:hypothetical protein